MTVIWDRSWGELEDMTSSILNETEKPGEDRVEEVTEGKGRGWGLA